MCSQWSIGVVLFCITIIFIHNADGQNGTLTCPTNWYEGFKVDIICTVNKILSKNCLNETLFQRNGDTYCTVSSDLYTSCLDAANTTQPANKNCWCLQNSTDYIFKLPLYPVRALHEGTWTCIINCEDSRGVPYRMPITNCSNVKVQDSPCNLSPNPCNPDGTKACFFDKNQEVNCACKDEYTNKDCSEKIDTNKDTNKDTVTGLAAGVGVLGALCIIGAVGTAIAVKKSVKAYNEWRVEVPAKIVADGNSDKLKEKLKADIVDDYFQRSQPVYFGTTGPPKSMQEVIILSQDTKELEDAKTKVSNIIKAYSDGNNASKVSATSTVAKHTTTDEGKRKRKNKKKSTKVGEELTTINQKSPPESAAEEGNSTRTRDLPLPNPSSVESRMAPISHLTSVERNSYIDSPRTMPLPPIKHT